MSARYSLRDPKILRWVMDHPGRGTPYSIRQLADAIGLSHHALIGHLLTGERGECDVDTAHSIAEAVGVALLVIFAPSASPEKNDPTLDRSK
ncbi:XRE family transcriptional regulator [Streptomyces sp. NBC_00893]|uniref:XRE family transcriptional regulator n=1 Tax=Streptomyces sp. NBC_00893 TaxID=2975862 RepID=UPI00224CFB3B|nr:XRE family transcriptional regulator [Streptomyces sp. NBC_00893]MCX4849781.1 XRE family transcriptional regulator [Streptomyces sp. NBC_00893]